MKKKEFQRFSANSLAVEKVPQQPSEKKSNTKVPVQSPFSKEDLNMYQKLLIEKLAIATAELDVLTHPQKALVNVNGTSGTHKEAGDIADQIVPEINPFFIKKKIASTLKYIRANEAAQGRIEDGTFGICFYTGEPIPTERLILEPHTRWKSAEIKENAERERAQKKL